MFPKWTLKKFLIKALKIAAWITLSIVMLFIVVALSIQIPAVQNRLTQEAVGFVKKKIKTEVSLQHISLSFPKNIVLTGLYLEDQSRDTLLYAGELSVNTDLWALLNHGIQLNDVEIDQLRAFISRPAADSTYNFDYIIKAFAGDSTVTEQPDTTQVPWEFTVGTVALTNTHIVYADAFGGDNADLRLEQLEVDVDELELSQPKLIINSIDMTGVDVDVKQRSTIRKASSPAPTDPNDSSAFEFDIDQVNLKNIIASYQNNSTGQTASVNLGELVLKADEINLRQQNIELDEFSLSDTFISYQQAAQAPNKSPSVSSGDTASKPWTITLADLDLRNNTIRYEDFNSAVKKNELDFSHLWISKVNIGAEDLKWKGDMMEGKLNELSFNEKSGFAVTSFKTTFALTDKSAVIKDFLFVTPNTTLTLDGESSFTSLSSLGENYADAKINLDISKSKLSLKDVLYFSPHLLDSIPLKLSTNTAITIDASLAGAVKDLKVDHLIIDALSKTSLQASGSIKGLPGSDALMHITLQQFHTVKEDIVQILPDTLLPKGIQLPAWITLRGKFDGTPSSPKTTLALTSDVGAINLTADMELKEHTESSSYKANIKVNDLQIGKLLGQQETMGNITVIGSVEGTGLTIEDLDTELDIAVPKFEYQNYTYTDFKINGRLERYFFSGRASVNDKNLSFNLDGDLNYNGEIPEYKFTFDLKNADFKALNFTERPLRARGKIDVKLATSDFKIINGTLDIRKVAIYNGEALYAVDSLLFASIDQEGKSNISIRSDLLSGDFEGTINLFSMPDAIMRHFNNYFSLRDTTSNKPVAPQNFSFSLILKNTDLLTEVILPDLDPFVPGKITGIFNSSEKKLDLDFDVARINYAGVGLDSIRFNVNSDPSSLTYGLALRKIRMDTLRIEALTLTGSVAHDSIRTKFTVLDSLQKDKYVLGGAFYSLEKTFRFHFLPNEVIMNYAPWKTPQDNALLFTSKGISAHNFSITNINERIQLLTQQNADSSTAIVFKDLNLQNITRLVEGTILADGLINGDFYLAGEGSFQTNLKIKDLNIFNRPWGDLGLKFARKGDGPSTIDVDIKGEAADIKASGSILSDSISTTLDLTATLAKLNLALVEPFAGGQLKETKGALTGEFRITGKANAPSILGSVDFNDVSFVPSFVNSKFMLKKETINFTREGIVLGDFKIYDDKDNVALIKGTIRTERYTDFDMGLTLTAKNFQLINLKPGDNEMFYGNVAINTNAKISGSFTQPHVQMNISLDENTDLTYIVPQSEKGVLEQKGIVVFVDKDASKDPFLAAINARDTIKSNFSGIDLTANIELKDKEKFSIVIDPVTGDKLTVKGNSTLTLAIDPSGSMQLSGRYEISEGSYDLTFYKLVKRNFSIEKGSTITWAGEPLEATMDIRASFTVETSPMELFANAGAANNQGARQRLPFLVYLNIKGDLLAPEISFQLDMPPDKRNYLGGGVYSKIQDINTRESDLNKQVFALLILRRFISDDVFDSQQGDGVTVAARRSVSKLLTEQLNRLSENIKGLELSFDVKSYEDYSESGTSASPQGQTELQLGVSKSLLDDRLVVKVAGNVDIEGKSNQSSFSDYIGDLALEYKLTSDGRFRITGFRKSNYDIISGELIETGAGLIYIKDYNTLRELFKANATEK